MVLSGEVGGERREMPWSAASSLRCPQWCFPQYAGIAQGFYTVHVHSPWLLLAHTFVTSQGVFPVPAGVGAEQPPPVFAFHCPSHPVGSCRLGRQSRHMRRGIQDDLIVAETLLSS